MAYVNRVASFAPFGGGSANKGGQRLYVEADYSDDEAPFNARASLLSNSADDDSGDYEDGGNWALSLARLRERRRRPFTASGAAITVFAVLALLALFPLGFSFYRQWALAGASQALIGILGLALTSAVVLVLVLHLYALHALAQNPHATSMPRWTDFLLKLALLATAATAAATLRLWDNEPSLLLLSSASTSAKMSIFRYFVLPTRAWVLALTAGVAICVFAASVISTSVPYRRPALSYASSARTWALIALGAALACASLVLVTVIGQPGRYYDNKIVWAAMGAAVGAALVVAAFVVSGHGVVRSRGLSAAWLAALLLAAGATATTGALLYRLVVPRLDTPLVVSDNLFAAAVVAIGGAALGSLCSLVTLSLWKISEYVGVGGEEEKTGRQALAHELRGYTSGL